MSAPNPTAPPPRAERLLRRVLPPGVIAASILGDLQQEYEEEVRAGHPLAARARYWRSTLELCARYALRPRPIRALPRSNRRTSLPTSPPENLMSSLITDLRFTFRTFARSPLPSAIAVLTIALGVALTVQTFSQVYGTTLRPLPVPEPQELVSVSQTRGDRRVGAYRSVSLHDWVDYRRAESLRSSAAYYMGTANVAGEGSPPERFRGLFCSANLLDIVGVPPLLGRTFRPEDGEPDAPVVVVIAHDVWQSRYAGDPGIVGRDVRLNGERAEIVGVMPEGFRFPFDEDMWVPARFQPAAAPRGRGTYVEIVGRLAEGTSLAAAQAELEGINGEIAERHPVIQEGLSPVVHPFTESYMPAEINAAMFAMLAAVLGVLLIACVNVANLLLARAIGRSREVAIRAALGASRGRVVRMMMTETLVISTIGGLIGLAGARFAIGAYARWVEPIQKPYWIDFRLDTPALLFTAAIVLATALLAGLLPALRASGSGAGGVLREEGRGASSLRLGRLSRVLVIAEIALSAALLVAAGLMVQSVLNATSAELGFDPTGVVTGRVGLVPSDYPERSDRNRFFDELMASLRERAGIESATLASGLPGSQPGVWSVGVEGVAYAHEAEVPRASGAVVGTDYFATFGVSVVRGRSLLRDDLREDAEPAAVVNEAFVRRHLGKADPIGQRIRLGGPDAEAPWMRIVGVAPDLHVAGGVGGIGSDSLPREQVFVARTAFDMRTLTIAVRTALAPEHVYPMLREAVAALDPNLPVYELETAEALMQRHTWAFRMFGTLFAALGGAALFLAAVGLYGVMAFSVGNRTRELGIRMALGAESGRILSIVVRSGGAQLLVGLGLGLALGALLSQPLAVMTYRARPGDPTLFIVVALTLLVTGLLATLIPARRAIAVDPADALRSDV